MEKQKVVSLFSGIGAYERALQNIGVEVDLVNYCEFDKYKSKGYSIIHNEPESKNLWDITKVNPKEVGGCDTLVYSPPCFGAGTLIMTEKGYKNIEDINVGDYVLTHKNRYRKVLDWGYKEGETVGLKVAGVVETRVTLNHPYYTKRMEKMVEKKGIKEIELEKQDPRWVEVSKLQGGPRGHRLAVPILKQEKNPYKLTEEECWLLGRYVADGHYRHDLKPIGEKNRYEIIYSIGATKLEEFKENVKTKHVYYNKHSQSVYRGTISDKEFLEKLIDMGFKKGSKNKNIPKTILELPKKLGGIFLEGYLSGDGCDFKDRQGNILGKSITTISKELAVGLQLLVLKTKGVNCTITYSEREKTKEIQGRIVNQNNTYQIRYHNKPTKKHYTIEEGMLWTPYKGLKETIRKETVYNMEVEEDNSYTANNVVVHNCQSFSISGKMGGTKDMRGTLFFNALDIIREKQPKYAVMENVDNLVNSFREDFDMMLEGLEEAGYNNYWKVINAKDFIPQNRNRVYIVSIRKDIDDKTFEFPEGTDTRHWLDVIDITDRRGLTARQERMIAVARGENTEDTIKIEGDIDFESSVITLRQSGLRFQSNREYPTITAHYGKGGGNFTMVGYKGEVFGITPKNCLKLMGFEFEDGDKLDKEKISVSRQYQMAGDSVCVPVLEGIFKNLYKIK